MRQARKAIHDRLARLVIVNCELHDRLPAIETLPAGGTRVVMMNGDDAAVMVKAFGSKVMTGPVKRTHWMRAR